MRFGQNRLRFRHGENIKRLPVNLINVLALDQIPEGYNATVIHNNNLKNN